MTTIDVHAELKRQHVIEQLEQLGSYDNDGYTYKELVRKLAVARAMDVEIKSPHSGWF